MRLGKVHQRMSLIMLLGTLLITGCGKQEPVAGTTQIMPTYVSVKEIKEETYANTLTYSGYVGTKETKNFAFEY